MGKYKSRARRASDQGDEWRKIAGELREISEQIENVDRRKKAEEKVVLEMAEALGIEADSLEGLETHETFDREDYERRVNAEVGETLTEEEAIAKAQASLDVFDASELESLLEEITSWRDNMSGANMEHLPKYEEVSEAADSLEQIETDAPDVKTVDEIEEAADTLEERADELDQVAFPGMY